MFLSVVAVMFALGATFAFKSAPPIPQWKYIPEGPTCESVDEGCHNNAGSNCLVGGFEVRNNNQVSTCGSLMKRTP